MAVEEEREVQVAEVRRSRKGRDGREKGQGTLARPVRKSRRTRRSSNQARHSHSGGCKQPLVGHWVGREYQRTSWHEERVPREAGRTSTDRGDLVVVRRRSVLEGLAHRSQLHLLRKGGTSCRFEQGTTQRRRLRGTRKGRMVGRGTKGHHCRLLEERQGCRQLSRSEDARSAGTGPRGSLGACRAPTGRSVA